jgi:exopolysaccharide biosynthesis polyprenyl glycosylphosphotransferase
MFANEIRKQKVIVAAVDSVAVAGAFLGALAIHDPSAAIEERLLEANPAVVGLGVVAVVSLWLLVFHAESLYSSSRGGLKELFKISKACAIATLLASFAGYLAYVQISRIAVILSYFLSVAAVFIGRALTRSCIFSFYSRPKIAVPFVIVGFNSIGHYLFDQITDEMTNYEPVGFIDDGSRNSQYRGYPVLGGTHRLGELAAMYPGLAVAIALPDASREQQEAIIRICEQHRLKWSTVPWMYHSVTAGLKVEMAGVLPLISPRSSNVQGLNFALKRMFDVAAATALLIISAPVIALSAVAVWVFDGRPMFISQTRVGIRGELFQLIKLRTMKISASDTVHREYAKQWISNGHAAASTNGNGVPPLFKLADDVRVTRIGKILRRFSIDELPQLLNVVRGEMSLIGPRPALPYELELYQAWHRTRLDAVPGITGLWQVSGRNRLSFDEMVRLDVRYLEEWSLTNDLRILLRTLPTLLHGDGV